MDCSSCHEFYHHSCLARGKRGINHIERNLISCCTENYEQILSGSIHGLEKQIVDLTETSTFKDKNIEKLTKEEILLLNEALNTVE